MRVTSLAMTMVLAMFTALPAAALDLNPGRYEITAKVQMPGMPGGGGSQTSIQCLTVHNLLPGISAGARGCKLEEMNTRGDTVTYTMVCGPQGMSSRSTGRIIFRGDTFEGASRTEMGPSAGGMTVTTVIEGKRIGRCDE